MASLNTAVCAGLPPISSTKALHGHTLGVAGALELAASLLALNDDFLPASSHIDELDPDFADMPILRKVTKAPNADVVLSNSFI